MGHQRHLCRVDVGTRGKAADVASGEVGTKFLGFVVVVVWFCVFLFCFVVLV